MPEIYRAEFDRQVLIHVIEYAEEIGLDEEDVRFIQSTLEREAYKKPERWIPFKGIGNAVGLDVVE